MILSSRIILKNTLGLLEFWVLYIYETVMN